MRAEQNSTAFWAVVEHAETFARERSILDGIVAAGGKLTTSLAAQIARDFKVARTLKGVGQSGYGQIAEALNSLDLSDAEQLPGRAQAIENGVAALQSLGYPRMPSAISKWLAFMAPVQGYIYDKQAAQAVGAGLNSLAGMRGFFGILNAAGVEKVRADLSNAVADLKLTYVPERVIDKFLWLRGWERYDPAFLEQKGRAALAANPNLRLLAERAALILPDNYFDLLKDPA